MVLASRKNSKFEFLAPLGPSLKPTVYYLRVFSEIEDLSTSGIFLARLFNSALPKDFAMSTNSVTI